LLSIAAVYEMMRCCSLHKCYLLSIPSYLLSGIAPFIKNQELNFILKPIIAAYIFYTFLILLIKHKSIDFGSITKTIFITLVYPISLSCLIYIRDSHSKEGLYLILLSFIAAWLSDTGAYFTGFFFGKRKLCPEISPKKTVEGAIGGVISAIIGFVLLSLVYSRIYNVVEINYIAVIILAPIASIFGMIGDLSASVIKRENGIKDYGAIMPGHGGVMDRFDSVIFVLPLIYFLSQYITIIRID
jgi:phosphatidate cytidylyltransferase